MAVKTRTKQCRHCEVAIDLDPHGNESWIHRWNGEAQCRKMSTRTLLGTVAAPRPPK